MSDRLDPLFSDAIKALEDVFQKLGNEWVVIGGVAAGLLGVPRATKDVDAMTIFDTADVDRLLEVAEAHGFQGRFKNTGGFARESRVAFLVFGAERVLVDIALGCMPFEQEVIDRAITIAEGGCQVRVPTAEDLIIMKAIASRPQDLVDISNLAAINQNLDRKRIRFWVDQYAGVLYEPDLWQRVEKLLDAQ